MQYRFLHPYPDGRVFNRVVGGADLQTAFNTFAREHLLPELTATIGVWEGTALVARVLVGRNNETGEPVPYLREIDPPPRQTCSLACGD
jgi:hypothetical protein